MLRGRKISTYSIACDICGAEASRGFSAPEAKKIANKEGFTYRTSWNGVEYVATAICPTCVQTRLPKIIAALQKLNNTCWNCDKPLPEETDDEHCPHCHAETIALQGGPTNV